MNSIPQSLNHSDSNHTSSRKLAQSLQDHLGPANLAAILHTDICSYYTAGAGTHAETQTRYIHMAGCAFCRNVLAVPLHSAALDHAVACA